MIIGNQVSSQLDNTNKGDSHFLRTLNTVIATPRQFNQIYIVTYKHTQLTQASFLQKNQMLQNDFVISVTLR